MISLNKNLATRISAQNLFEKIIKENTLELDFSNVLIVSRSFANEFVNLEKTHNIKIKKLNMNKDIKYMFENADKPLDNDILARNKYSTTSVEKYANLI